MTSFEKQDSICFHEDQARILLIHAKKGLIVDSLITTYDNQIETLEGIISEKNKQLSLSTDLITTQSTKIKKLERRVLFLGIFSGVCIIGIILLLLK